MVIDIVNENGRNLPVTEWKFQVGSLMQLAASETKLQVLSHDALIYVMCTVGIVNDMLTTTWAPLHDVNVIDMLDGSCGSCTERDWFRS